MTLQRMSRVLIAAALIGGASLAVSGLLAGNAPAAAAPPAAPLVMLDYTWSGAAPDDDFDHFCNWSDALVCPGEGAPPDGTDDDATFPASTDNPPVAWAVDLVTVTIGDMTIKESINFGAVSGTPALDVEKLEIDAAAGEITITIGENAEITITNP